MKEWKQKIVTENHYKQIKISKCNTIRKTAIDTIYLVVDCCFLLYESQTLGGQS